ncbi:vitamin K epoxide reductase family protein [Flavobacterium aestivum]|uniref:vitamin K epoxide reductase family protein n=1 Tax=Flavobacterium aestivum TaxID=3003257 RepID=UPI0024821716|nr:vitamin K epoxide reductase family protein [Flavobacterium aestivum]
MIKLVNQYLSLNFYLNAKEEFEELFLSHPNYPSVFAITDSLDMLSIENIAIKVPKEQLGELPLSFLAIYNDDLVLVTKNDKTIQIETEKGVKSIVTIDDFCKGWNGVIVAIEPNQVIITEGEINIKWITYGIPTVSLILLSIFYNNYSLSNAILLFTSVVGVLVSIFIVQEKFGLKNEIVSKFCNINANVSCDSVIKSEKGDINKWMGFTDLPLLFFSINVVSILLNPIYSSKIIGLLSLFSFPVILYSIWLQKFQIKKWCMLCLVVSAILVLQGLIGYFLEQPLVTDIVINDFSYLFSVIVCTSLWLMIKPVLETKFKAENEVKELKKFKRSYSVFEFLSKEVPVMDGFAKLKGIQFGNNNSSVGLSIFLSPSCGHCHKAFEDAINLVRKYPEKVFLKVLFNINPENNDNPYKAVVDSLLEINNSFPEKIGEAISDWHIHKMGLEPWLKKWKVAAISMKVNQQIQQQYDWCLENEFNYTPVKIVNGKKFPNEYSISELKYFLNDFSEEKDSIEMESLVEL